MVKKLFAIILTICMVITMLPQIAFMAVQYPQEVTVFDSAKSGFKALSNEYGALSISGVGKHTENGDGSLTLGSDEGVQFTPNEKFGSILKNGALLEINVDFIINATENDKTAIFAMRNSSEETLNMFEYYESTPMVRAFSWNQRETTLDKETLSETEFSVNLKLNTKNGNGDASFTYKQKDSTEAKQVTYNTLNLNTETANYKGNGVKFSTLWENTPKLLRFYLSANDTLKSVKINLTDLSTNSLYASINTAESAKDVKEVFDYYSKNGTFSYGDRFDELSDSEKTAIYNRFITGNFTNDTEVQALFDKLVGKEFSIVTKTYTYDLETGESPFTNSEIVSLDNNKVMKLTGTAQLEIADLKNVKGPIVTQYDYYYNTASGEGTYFYYLTPGNKMLMSKVMGSKYIAVDKYGTGANLIGTSKLLVTGSIYGMQQCFDKETLRAQTNVKESTDTVYSSVRIDESGKSYTTFQSISDGVIRGIDLRMNTADYFDNITIKVYNPVYTALYYTETADEVKNVFDTYKSIGALDVEDNLGEEVYSQFIGSSYTSTASLEAAIKVAAEFAALGRDAYVYDTYVKSGDTALDSEFEAGAITYGAKAYTDTAGTVVTLVIAQYKDKELTNLTYAEKTLAQGINDISDSLTVSESAGTTLKVFAVDKNANPYVVHKLLTGK